MRHVPGATELEISSSIVKFSASDQGNECVDDAKVESVFVFGK